MLALAFVMLIFVQKTLVFAQNPQEQKEASEPMVIIIDGDNSPSDSIYGSVTENRQRLKQRAHMSSRGGLIVSKAKQYIGVPYQWGGTTSDGFDCSGFVKSIYAQNGIILKRLADEQFYCGHRIQKKNLEIGDLVFFETYTRGISHVGIYIGNNEFIHSSSSRGVAIDSLSDPYFKARYRGACRY